MWWNKDSQILVGMLLRQISKVFCQHPAVTCHPSTMLAIFQFTILQCTIRCHRKATVFCGMRHTVSVEQKGLCTIGREARRHHRRSESESVSNVCDVLLSAQLLPIETIEQKFLETGHTQMEVDSMHSAIDTHRKHLKISVPFEWPIVLQTAHTKHSYTVHQVERKEFFDLHLLSCFCLLGKACWTLCHGKSGSNHKPSILCRFYGAVRNLKKCYACGKSFALQNKRPHARDILLKHYRKRQYRNADGILVSSDQSYASSLLSPATELRQNGWTTHGTVRCHYRSWSWLRWVLVIVKFFGLCGKMCKKVVAVEYRSFPWLLRSSSQQNSMFSYYYGSYAAYWTSLNM